MDAMKEHDILIETVASMEKTICKLMDEIIRLNAKQPIIYLGNQPVLQPFVQTEPYPTPDIYKHNTITCTGGIGGNGKTYAVAEPLKGSDFSPNVR